MQTVTVEIKDNAAFGFLDNLERIHLLRIVKTNSVVTPPKQKLSERFSGCLSQERTEELQKELIQMRNEWERDTF
ncbi:MAG: hypothetical protein LBN37_08505 [Bacteroidales bacterium]|jgi:hypothetical protein|nr:hypothetical protein [Bacteroidales bacterium]